MSEYRIWKIMFTGYYNMATLCGSDIYSNYLVKEMLVGLSLQYIYRFSYLHRVQMSIIRNVRFS